jgi:hypothetical protein
MKLLGPHVIGQPGSLAEFMAATGAGCILYLNPPDRPIFAPITIGRIHPISEDDGGLLTDPAALGRKHAAELATHAARTGIKLWTGLNERNPDTTDKARAVCVYEQARVAAMNAAGLCAVVCNFGRGWPRELPDGSIDWAAFQALLECLPAGNFLGGHEYYNKAGPLAPDSKYHLCGRIFRCPFDVPILITECGMDWGGGQNDGFRGQGVSVADYTLQLARYRDLLATDPRVKGATVFTYGHTGDWGAFDIEPDQHAFVPTFAAETTRQMKLSDFPVPAGNNGFGWHWLPALSDVAPLDKTVALLKRMQGTGAKWVKLITSSGGDIGWERGATNTGACEMTFCAALDLGFGVVVRIFNSWAPSYITPAIRANLAHLLRLAQGKTFYVECANEIDAEATHYIDDDIAAAIVSSICDFIDACWEIGGGQIIPVWPAFGYGKRTRNWFQIAHDLGRGDCLNRCAIAVHNYASANRLFEPWDPDYIAGTPLSQAEYDAYPWRFGIGVVGQNPRPLAAINAKRRENADHISESEFASGWYTYRWSLQQLDALGHTDAPLLLTETGTRVGEMVDWEPRIDPLLHQERTRGMIADIRQQPRILMSAFWLFIGKTFAPTQPTWEDQCGISPIWDRRYNATMPAGEYAQIKTPAQLPIIDDLEANPVPASKETTIPPTPPPTPEPEPPEEEPVTYPDRTTPDWKLDPQWDHTDYTEAPGKPGDVVWELVRIDYAPDANANTIWISVEGKAADGTLPDGAQVHAVNGGLPEFVVPLKAPPDLQDIPMYKTSVVRVWITDALGRQSCEIGNIRGDIVGLPAGVNAYHIGRRLYLARRTVPGITPPVDPPVTPGDVWSAQDAADLLELRAMLDRADTLTVAFMQRHS